MHSCSHLCGIEDEHDCLHAEEKRVEPAALGVNHAKPNNCLADWRQLTVDVQQQLLISVRLQKQTIILSIALLEDCGHEAEYSHGGITAVSWLQVQKTDPALAAGTHRLRLSVVVSHSSILSC
jgi:hypothetical protein